MRTNTRCEKSKTAFRSLCDYQFFQRWITQDFEVFFSLFCCFWFYCCSCCAIVQMEIVFLPSWNTRTRYFQFVEEFPKCNFIVVHILKRTILIINQMPLTNVYKRQKREKISQKIITICEQKPFSGLFISIERENKRCRNHTKEQWIVDWCANDL